MAGAHRSAQAAQGRLARLGAVIAVLAGLAFLLGAQCTDEVLPGTGGGRGMQMVENIAQRWGIDHVSGGKRVWFELETQDPD